MESMAVGNITFGSIIYSTLPLTMYFICFSLSHTPLFHSFWPSHHLTPTPDPHPDPHSDPRYATEHRCGVCIKGPGLTDAVGGTDPLKDNLPLTEVVPLEPTDEVRAGSLVRSEDREELEMWIQ